MGKTEVKMRELHSRGKGISHRRYSCHNGMNVSPLSASSPASFSLFPYAYSRFGRELSQLRRSKNDVYINVIIYICRDSQVMSLSPAGERDPAAGEDVACPRPPSLNHSLTATHT